MEAMILQNGARATVLNESSQARLATANAAIRAARQRFEPLRVTAVRIDGALPQVLLAHAPDPRLVEAMSGLHSRRLEPGLYQVRGTAFGVDWQWAATKPLLSIGPVHCLPDEDAGVRNEDMETAASPLFGGRVLRLVGSAE